MEEISEIMSTAAQGHLHTPCMIYNWNWGYDYLRGLLDRMVAEELSSDEKLKGISFVRNLDEIRKVLDLSATVN